MKLKIFKEGNELVHISLFDDVSEDRTMNCQYLVRNFEMINDLINEGYEVVLC